MSISWVKDELVTSVSHVGLVMSPAWSRDVQVMSDVWDAESVCYVWDPVAHRRVILNLGCFFDPHSTIGRATVDAPQAIKDEWADIEEREAEEKRVREHIAAEQAAESRARDEALKIKYGTEVLAVEGKKKGARGVVFYTGPGNWGPRVGFKDSSGTDHFTPQGNVVGVLPGKDVSYVPPGGWRQYLDAKIEEVQAIMPRKGNRVRRLSDGLEGVVFWVHKTDPRLGFKVKGSDQAHWVNANEITILDVHGNPKVAPTPAPTAVVEAPKPPEVNPLAHLPAPYCDIRGILPPMGASTCWTAVDERGEFLMNLTEASAAKIRKLVELAD